MGIRSKVGDIFLIPLLDDFAVGQIVDKYLTSLYVIVFGDRRSADSVAGLDLTQMEPVFGTSTLDALLFHGRWPIVTNSKSGLDSWPRPVFKIGFQPNCYIESFRGESLRKATPSEEIRLRFRTVSAPIIIDKAVKAYFGIGEWDLQYEDLKYDYVNQSAALL